MSSDYVLNGQGYGPVGASATEDPLLKRPFFDNRGNRCVMIRTGRILTNNNTGEQKQELKKILVQDALSRGLGDPMILNNTSMRKEQWVELDRAVIRAARFRLRAWADLAAANSYGGFNAFGRATLEYEAMSDPGEAVVDMDVLSDARTDSPLFKLRSLPLPVTHSDFYFSKRRIEISANNGYAPIDTTMAEAAGRRVAESIEKVTIGVDTGMTYGTQTQGYGASDGSSTVYGYTNYPNRITYNTLTIPTGNNPDATITDVIGLLELLRSYKFYGPYMIYHSVDWSKWMQADYARLGGANANMTLKDRLLKIEDVMDVRRLDYLTNPYTIIVVQMTPDVARAINGMDLTTVQWPSQGGMRLNFKVMAIQVPQLRCDYNGVAAIVHATTS